MKSWTASLRSVSKLRACRDQRLALVVVLVLDKVLDETLGQVFRFLLPFGNNQAITLRTRKWYKIMVVTVIDFLPVIWKMDRIFV